MNCGQRVVMASNYRTLSKNFLRLATALMVLMGSVACREQVVHNLGENEVNRLLTRLHDVGIEAQKERQPDGSWALAVEHGEASIALKHLDESRLLREVTSVGSEKGSLFSSREEQRFKLERALAREIEGTLASIPGVLEARVNLHLPPTDPIFGVPSQRVPGSASVLLIAKHEYAIASSDIVGVVAGASGIEARQVTVLISRSAERDSGERLGNLYRDVLKGQGRATSGEGGWYSRHALVLQIITSFLIVAVGSFSLLRSTRGLRLNFNGQRPSE